MSADRIKAAIEAAMDREAHKLNIKDTIEEEGEEYFKILPEQMRPLLPHLKHAFYTGGLCALLLALRKHGFTDKLNTDVFREIKQDLDRLTDELQSDL